jgi:hypothetical protein
VAIFSKSKKLKMFNALRKPFYTPPAHCIMSYCEFAKASARRLRQFVFPENSPAIYGWVNVPPTIKSRQERKKFNPTFPPCNRIRAS